MERTCSLLFARLTALALGLAGLSLAAAQDVRQGAPWDWSHRHLIYANPDTREEAAAKGRQAEWERNAQDPRFASALRRKNERARTQAGEAIPKAAAARTPTIRPASPTAQSTAAVGGIVDHYYLTILGRSPDAAGRAFHLAEVDRLVALAVDAREALRVISKYFFFSPEYLGYHRSDADFVEDLYRAYFQRASDPGGKAYWVGQLAAGPNREAVILGFMFSPEFQAFMDGAVGAFDQRPETALVMDSYRSEFSRLPDSGGFSSWRSWLRVGQCDGTIDAKAGDMLAVHFFSSPEYQGRYRTDAEFVADLYDAILRRAPDAEGFNFWAGRIAAGAMTRAQVIGEFLASDEWAGRVYQLVDAGCNQAHRDWSVLAGGTGGFGIPGVFPAKYGFDITAPPSCANDFVVFTTGSAGAASAASASASMTGTVNGNFNNNKDVTIDNNGRTLVLTSSNTLNTGFNFLSTPNGNSAAMQAIRAANLAAAINRNGDVVAVSASSSGSVVTVTAKTAGTFGNTIGWSEGLGGFGRNQNTMSGGAGASGQPTIVAYNQLNKSCGVSGYPSLFWSYNTGTGASVRTSPVLSLDGTQVAFLQSTGGAASLVLLKWSAGTPGTLGAPVAPTSVAPGAYRACTAPCMTVMALSGAPANTRSSPYYDYSGDQLWVGADNGTLHRYTGVFNGTPAASGAPWPVTVVSGRMLSSPVYDFDQQRIFVGSAREAGGSPTGGRLHSVSNVDASVSATSLLAGDLGAGSTGVADAPMLDQLARRVYALVFTDTSTGGSGCNNQECNAVFQFRTDIALAGQALNVAKIGRGDRLSVLYSGAFDTAYYASANPASPSGSLYVCASEPNEGRRPQLWKIPIVANVMGTPVAGPELVDGDVNVNDGHCSPITLTANGGSEFLFVSVPDRGKATGCDDDCIYAYDLGTVGTWGPGVVAAAGLQAAMGTGGIVIDNVSLLPGASQVYYMTRGTEVGFGSVIQASQSGLN